MNALAIYCVVATNLVFMLVERLVELERPYQAQYESLSDMGLIFGFEDEYDHLMLWLSKGGSGERELEKFVFRAGSYVEELRHRRSGKIDWPSQYKRAQDYVERNSGYSTR